MLPGLGAAVLRSPVQGRRGANMWAVVVLGLLSAVFAWVWFGGRGNQKGSESRGSELTTEPVQDPKPRSGLQCEAGSPATSKEGKWRDAASPAASLEEKPCVREAGCLLSSEKLPEGGVTREAAHASAVSATGCVERLEGPPAPEEQPVLASLCPAPQHAGTQGNREKPLHAHNDLPETGKTMVSHGSAPQHGGTQGTGEKVKTLKAHKEDLPETSEVVTHPSAPQHGGEVEPMHAHGEIGDTMPGHGTALEEEASGRAACGSCAPHRAEDEAPPAQIEESLLPNEETLANAQENVTECLTKHLTEGSSTITEDVHESKLEEGLESELQSESMSPKKVDVSSDNNFEQYGCMQPDSPDQSEMHSQLSAHQESTTGSQDNIASSHLAAADSVSSQTGHQELAITQKSEAAQKSPPTNVDTLPFLEENADLKGERGSFASQSETRLQDGDLQRTKRVAAVQPMPQNVSLGFKVHYITSSASQIVAVTGDHEKLGRWEAYFPLTPEKGGLWSHSITLPGDTNVEWKFVMVENGKIKRWEECHNRCLKTAHEDIAPQQWWGYP